MEMASLLKDILFFFDKIDKIIAVAAVIFIILGCDLKIETKHAIINLDRKQVIYMRTFGFILIIVSLLPAIISWYFQPVQLKDLVELRRMVGETQGSFDRGRPNPNRTDGDNCFYAKKEMTYGPDFNIRVATKLDGMINAMRP